MLKKIKVGYRITTPKCGDVVVTAQVSKTRFEICFVNSGYRKVVALSSISNKNLLDPYQPTVAGVGYLGNLEGVDTKLKEYKHIYVKWNGMIRSCYDESYNQYKYHGFKGKKVAEMFHSFSLFHAWYKGECERLSLPIDRTMFRLSEGKIMETNRFR